MGHPIETFFTTANLQLILLIGSGVLAISLLVLALTRWGHSRPVWKCVILSFVAHILLMGYAYGTRMIFETPVATTRPDPLRVNLVEEFGKSVADLDTLDASPQPWDEFVNQQALPTLDELDRPVIDSEVVIERQLRDELASPKTAMEEDLPIDLPQDFLPPSKTTFKPDRLSAIELKDTQLDVPEIDVKRRGDDHAEIAQSPKLASPADLNRADIKNEFQPSTKPIPSDNSRPAFVSELVDQNAELPEADALPSPAVDVPSDDFRPLKRLNAPNRMQLISNPRRLADGKPLPKMYSLRNTENRLTVAQRRGGSVETERAVNRALQWLAENQEADGRWDADKWGAGKETQVFGHDRKGAGADADCGITALAALSFLAAGHTHLEGPYQNHLRQAFEYLVRQQKIDGNLAGEARLFAKMYCHSMSLLALSEALALTGDGRLMQPVQKGVDYSVNSQNRADGGWRYQPGDSGDMSQFGWQVLALHSAKLGGAVVPDATTQRMHQFLNRCSSGVGGGLASYRPNQGPSTTMTAEALLCRYFLDKSVAPDTLMEASRRIATERPTPHQVNLYYWYYGTLAMYHVGGEDWEQWNKELKNTLLGLQIKTGEHIGSWPADDLWGGYGGRVYSTAMATLSLEVYYRYLPMYDVAEAEEVQAKDSLRR